MPKPKAATLTDRTLRSTIARAKETGERLSVPVGDVPNLQARVSPAGKVSWLLRYWDGAGKQCRLTLSSGTLTDARRWARATRAQAESAKIGQGEDPRQVLAQKRREKEGETVADLSERYLLDVEKRLAPSTLAAYRNILKARILPALGRLRPGQVTRREVRALIEGIREEGKPTHANRVLASLKALFAWALDKEIIDASPTAGLKATEEEPRDRVYSDDELRRILAAVPGTSLESVAPFLLLTAARIGEVTAARWEDFDLERKTWTIRAAKTKGGTRVLPLSSSAVRILKALPEEGDRVFPMAYPKAGIRKVKESSGVEDFRPHTLRTTARTRFSELGISPDVGERILGHALGRIRGTYDKHDFLPEMRTALDRWSREVGRILSGRKTEKVVKIR